MSRSQNPWETQQDWDRARLGRVTGDRFGNGNLSSDAPRHWPMKKGAHQISERLNNVKYIPQG